MYKPCLPRKQVKSKMGVRLFFFNPCRKIIDYFCETDVLYPSSKKIFINLANKCFLFGGAEVVLCQFLHNSSEYKARGQGWDAAGTGLCSPVEGTCNVT